MIVYLKRALYARDRYDLKRDRWHLYYHKIKLVHMEVRSEVHLVESESKRVLQKHLQVLYTPILY
jgi:hypothetical protein